MRTLPNLFAVRKTLHFQTSFEVVSELARAASGSSSGFIGNSVLPQLFTGSSTHPVAYRAGKEVFPDHIAAGSSPGLTTNGEFGPILTIALGDAEHGSILWSYWQKDRDACLAVFQYQVPSAESHYVVKYREAGATQTHPAYHGEIAIAVNTGSILRISMISDPVQPFEPANGIFVEYGPVILGNRAYIVPLHAAAISKVPIRIGDTTAIPVQNYLNDVTFTNFNLLRADSRILSDEEFQRLHDDRTTDVSDQH